MNDLISIEERYAEATQHCCGGALAHADGSGEAEDNQWETKLASITARSSGVT